MFICAKIENMTNLYQKCRFFRVGNSMPFFQWTKAEHGLNIPEMDLEHQTLINLMNNLFEKNEDQLQKEEMSYVIKELIDYVIIHFKDEETFLEKINYPDLAPHKKIHQKLLKQLKMYYEEFLKQNSGKIDDRFFEFLSLWLTSHIQHFDMDYSHFLHSETPPPKGLKI